jgi:hypothetical protein
MVTEYSNPINMASEIKIWNIKVNPELDQKVKKAAKDEGGNKASLVRRAVIMYLNAVVPK